MAEDFSPEQKLSMVIKHQNDIAYTAEDKYWFSESIAGGHVVLSREMWIDDDLIVWNDPTASLAALNDVDQHVVESRTVILTEDVTVADSMNWLALDGETELDNWLHPLHFGNLYSIKLYDANDRRIYTDASWIFNYKTGALSFSEDPATLSYIGPFKIVGYRYIGEFFRASTPTSFLGLDDVFTSGVISGQIIAALSSSGVTNSYMTVMDIQNHFDEASGHLIPPQIDHNLLINASGYHTHLEIDEHIADMSAHFYPPAIDHDALLNASGHLSHTNIDNYINAVSGYIAFIPHLTQPNYLYDGSRQSTSGWVPNEYTSGTIAIEDSIDARSGKALVITNSAVSPSATWTYKHHFTTGDRTTYNIRFKYKATIVDDIDPIITSGPTISNVGASMATVNFTVDSDCAVYALVLASSDPTPSATTIINAGVSKTDIVEDVADSINIIGLTPTLSYKIHIVAKDTNNNISVVNSSIEFITTDVVPAFTTGPIVLVNWPNSQVYYTVDTDCDVYIYLVEESVQT